MPLIARLGFPDVQRRDRLRRLPESLPETHILLGMRHAGWNAAKGLVERIADGTVEARLGAGVSAVGLPGRLPPDRLGNRRRDVAAPVRGLQDPGKVVHAGDPQVELAIRVRRTFARIPDDARAHGIVPLHARHVEAVAERKAFQVRRVAAQSDAIRRGGVDVVDDPGVRATAVNVPDAIENHRQLPQRAEDAARPDRVARTHADAMFLRHRAIGPAELHRPVCETQHHKVGAWQHLPPVLGRLDRQPHAVRGGHHLRQLRHLPQADRVCIHQPKRAMVEMRRVHHLPDCLPPEEQAARPDHHHLGMLRPAVFHGHTPAVRGCRRRKTDYGRNHLSARRLPGASPALPPGGP